MANSFVNLKKIMETMKNTLKETDKEVNTVEVEEIKTLIEKYDVIIKDDSGEKDLIFKYEAFYDQLIEYVSNKKKQVNDIEENIKNLSGFTNVGNFTTVLNKKKDNTNQIIDCINRIVERIEKLETNIYDIRMKELNNMKVEKYDVVVKVDIISNSMDLLKEWSKKNTYNIIFDSNINGDGTNKKLLYDKLMNKSNLYFISFDDNDNVYGGYVNKKIDQLGDYNVKFNCYVIYDKQSFVFSLIRNGKVNNKRYFLKQSQSVALGLYDNSPLGGLYEFGNDMRVHKVGSDDSWCNNEDCFYDYKQDNNPFTDIIYPKKFAVQRIVVIEMN